MRYFAASELLGLHGVLCYLLCTGHRHFLLCRAATHCFLFHGCSFCQYTDYRVALCQEKKQTNILQFQVFGDGCFYSPILVTIFSSLFCSSRMIFFPSEFNKRKDTLHICIIFSLRNNTVKIILLKCSVKVNSKCLMIKFVFKIKISRTLHGWPGAVFCSGPGTVLSNGKPRFPPSARFVLWQKSIAPWHDRRLAFLVAFNDF